MALIVQKFGGTSVANTQMILAAARKAIRAQQEGNQVVVVVSAMGKNTDHLIQLALEINERPPAREMDMLLSTGEQVSVALMAMAVDSLGHKAVSLTGAQIGIRTDSSHTKARIRSISTDRVRQLLDDGNIVIAAGFQGIDENLNITTLGRGGSDTTAVALAAVLDADACEIFTDVDGVYTTDPRILPEARLTRQVSYDEMLELASLGAGVMHSRSIEFGKKFHVPIHVRSSLSDTPGSFIVDEPEAPNLPVSGATLTKDEARIAILGVPDAPDIHQQIFEPIAAQRVTVDMIVQSPSRAGAIDISFTVPRHEYEMTRSIVEPIVSRSGGQLGDCSADVSKVSVVGLGMPQQTGVAARMFAALAREEINLQMITTSEIKISVLVERSQALRALRTVHEEFGLHLPPDGAVTDPWENLGARKRTISAVDVIRRLQGVAHELEMEGLTIDQISLDETQSRITLLHVPNRPGIAAQIFGGIAAESILVDMIVQSYVSPDYADLSFTVLRHQFDEALAAAERLAAGYSACRVLSKREIGKLTVSGIGLRSHTGTAIGMFQALAESQIALEMVNTSEVRVNAVVDGAAGVRGVEQLREKFRRALR
ncbi:MAG TPA: aspartate kinase [Pirellulaceae bacterium]|nr:aspartate kinase [Pirellulaceae bacterium]